MVRAAPIGERLALTGQLPSRLGAACCLLLLQLWRARAVLKPAVLDELGKQREQALQLFFAH